MANKKLHVQCDCRLNAYLCGTTNTQICTRKKGGRYSPEGWWSEVLEPKTSNKLYGLRLVLRLGLGLLNDQPAEPEGGEGTQTDAAITRHQLQALSAHSFTYSWHGSYSKLANCRYSRRNVYTGYSRSAGVYCIRVAGHATVKLPGCVALQWFQYYALSVAMESLSVKYAWLLHRQSWPHWAPAQMLRLRSIFRHLYAKKCLYF